MNKIKDFWMQSYHTDKTAFFYEVLSFVFTVAASLTLAMTAYEPNMTIVYPVSYTHLTLPTICSV